MNGKNLQRNLLGKNKSYRSEEDYIVGDLMRKIGQDYYHVGLWYYEGGLIDNVYWEQPILVMGTPIGEGDPFFPDFLWLYVTAQGQQSVTLPCGTFLAWYFQGEDEYEEEDYYDFIVGEIWFVPYLGEVKMEVTMEVEEYEEGEHYVYTVLLQAELLTYSND